MFAKKYLLIALLPLLLLLTSCLPTVNYLGTYKDKTYFDKKLVGSWDIVSVAQGDKVKDFTPKQGDKKKGFQHLDVIEHDGGVWLEMKDNDSQGKAEAQVLPGMLVRTVKGQSPSLAVLGNDTPGSDKIVFLYTVSGNDLYVSMVAYTEGSNELEKRFAGSTNYQSHGRFGVLDAELVSTLYELYEGNGYFKTLRYRRVAKSSAK